MSKPIVTMGKGPKSAPPDTYFLYVADMRKSTNPYGEGEDQLSFTFRIAHGKYKNKVVFSKFISLNSCGPRSYFYKYIMGICPDEFNKGRTFSSVEEIMEMFDKRIFKALVTSEERKDGDKMAVISDFVSQEDWEDEDWDTYRTIEKELEKENKGKGKGKSSKGKGKGKGKPKSKPEPEPEPEDDDEDEEDSSDPFDDDDEDEDEDEDDNCPFEEEEGESVLPSISDIESFKKKELVILLQQCGIDDVSELKAAELRKLALALKEIMDNPDEVPGDSHKASVKSLKKLLDVTPKKKSMSAYCDAIRDAVKKSVSLPGDDSDEDDDDDPWDEDD